MPKPIFSFVVAVCFAMSFFAGCSQTSEPAVDQADVAITTGASEDTSTSDDESKPASESASEPASKLADSGDDQEKSTLYSPEAFRDAALNGKLRVVEVCLKDKIDVNEQDANGYSAIAMAAYNGHTQVVKLLLKNGSKVDPRDREGKTPLIHASSGPFAETAKVLVDAGAEINAIDTGEGFTPLMTAAALGNVEVVKVLIAAGADETLVDEDNESAEDFARENGHTKIIELLQAK